MPSRKPIIFFVSIVLIVGIITGYVVGTNTSLLPTVEGSNTLNVEITPRSMKLSVAQPCDFTAHIYNGSEPYSYYWTATSFLDENTTLEENYFVGNTNPVTFMFTESCGYADLSVTVKDSKGSVGYATVIVYDPNVFTLSSGVYPGAPDYTIFVEGITYHCKNEYGVLTSSSTNASYLIQSAIDALPSGVGGEVKLEAGTYYIDTTIDISQGEVRLYGESKSDTILMLEAGADTDIISVTDSIWDSRVEDLMLHGNKDNNAAGNGILITGEWKDGAIRRCTIVQMAENAIYANSATPTFQFGAIEDIYAEHNDGYGFYLKYCYGTSISKCWFLDDDDYAIRLDSALNVNIDSVWGLGDVIYESDTQGLMLFNCRKVTVSNSCFNHYFNGITLDKSYGCRLVNNYVYNTTQHCIMIYGSSNNTLTNNIMHDSTVGWAYGIYLLPDGTTNSTYNAISNNIIRTDGTNIILNGIVESNSGQDYNQYTSNVFVGITNTIMTKGEHSQAHLFYNATSWVS